MGIRAVAVFVCGILGGCANLGLQWRPVRQPPGRLLAQVHVTSTFDRQVVEGGQLRAFCLTRWRLAGDTLSIGTGYEAPDPEAPACQGHPTFLVRPFCGLTTREAIYYPTATPIVVIRCPYGAAGWVTGFSKLAKEG